jgi:hypothetical protein
MDFEQYFNSTPYGKYHKAKSAARDSWDTCKEEILSILINYRSNPLGYKDDKWIWLD